MEKPPEKAQRLSGGAPSLHGAVVLLEYLAAEIGESESGREREWGERGIGGPGGEAPG
ncbi:unnamed protein product [Brassica oleracea]